MAPSTEETETGDESTSRTLEPSLIGLVVQWLVCLILLPFRILWHPIQTKLNVLSALFKLLQVYVGRIKARVQGAPSTSDERSLSGITTISLALDTTVSMEHACKILSAASDEVAEVNVTVTASPPAYRPDCMDWVLGLHFPRLAKLSLTNYKGPHHFLKSLPALQHLELRYSSLGHYHQNQPFYMDDIGKELHNWWNNTDTMYNSRIWELLPTMETLVIDKLSVWKLRTRFEYTRTERNKSMTSLLLEKKSQ